MTVLDLVVLVTLSASLVAALALNPDLVIWGVDLPARALTRVRRRLRRWAR